MKKIYVGTCGYNYINWNNIFYPSSSNKLLYYSQNFNSVELNSTYYVFYSSKIWKQWYKNTHDNFKFSVKVHRTIINTNNYIKLKNYWKLFYKNIKYLKEKLDCLLFQFSQRFKFNDKSMDKLNYLSKILPKTSYKYIFEFRNISWFDNTEVLDFFKKNNWTICFIHINNQKGWISNMPQTSDFYPQLSKWHNYIINDTLYLRLHGTEGKYVGQYGKKLLNINKYLEAKNNYIFFNNTDKNIDALKDAKIISQLNNFNIYGGNKKHSYETFNGLYFINSKYYFEPGTLNEFKNIIAKSNPLKIRISGSNHTFNDISLCNEFIIRTTKLNKILSLDISKKQVTVESGIKLYKLNEFLKKHNLALPILPATSRVSLGGCISLGAHGSRINFGSSSNMVLNMILIDANGNELFFDNTNIILKALKCNLGCLGAIYSLTIQCENLYSIQENTENIDWNDFKINFKEILKQYPLTSGYLNPQNMKYKITYRKKIPYDNKISGYEVVSSSNVSNYYIECETGIEFDRIDIIEKFCKYYKDYYNKNNIPFHSELLIRFCDSDDTLISMTSGRKTIFVSAFFGNEIDSDTAIKILKTMSDYLVERGGRPHYGKINNLDQKKMYYIYGNNYSIFQQIKNDLDPDKIFSNKYIDRLFL